MSQYSSRINIQVSSNEMWKNLKNIDFEKYGIDNSIKNEFENYTNNNYIIDGDWSASEAELERLVYEIAVALNFETIIIADTTNIDVDSCNYCVFFIAERVKSKYFGDNSKKCEMFYSTKISDIQEWLEYGNFRISEKEQEKLSKFDIILKKKVSTASKTPKKSSIESDHKNKYISKINILYPDPKEFLGYRKNFFRTNNFQYCTEIEDTKMFFKDYKHKSLFIDNWDISPRAISWFIINNMSDALVLIETRMNKPNSPITYCCQFPFPDKGVVKTLNEPIKADIRNVEEWMKELKVRMTPKRKQILKECIE